MLKNAKEGLRSGERCDLCGTEVRIVNTVDDDLGSFAICAGCAELWTAYLMHHPRPRHVTAEPPYPRAEFEAD